MAAQGTTVVGVDGSDCSRAALEFALDEAARRGAAARVVLAMPETEYWATANGMSPSVVEELSHSVEKVGREMVDDALRERGGAQPDVPVEIIALGGSPGHVLVEQSREAPGGAAQERRTVAADQETRANGRRVTAVTRDRLGHLLKSRWV